MRELGKRINDRFAGSYLLLVVLVLWQIAPSIGLVDPTYLPSLSRVLQETFLVGWQQVLLDVFTSLRRVFLGFVLAIILALPVGFILAGALPRIARFFNPLMFFLSQIPPFILFPVFAIVFGIGESGILMVIFWSAFWPILFATITGTAEVEPQLLKAARAMDADKISIFFSVVIPSALPRILTGMRFGLTFCFMMLIGAETIGASSGLGWEIHMAQRMAIIPRIYYFALLSALIGLLINIFFEWLEKSLVTWNPTDVELAQ